MIAAKKASLRGRNHRGETAPSRIHSLRYRRRLVELLKGEETVRFVTLGR